MCGIVAGIGDGIKKEMIERGLRATQSRGKDATGIYQPKHGIVKGPMDAFEFIKTKEFKQNVKKDKMFIGHCRQWTSGKPENNENNHPFDGEKFILVHNGVVRMKELENYPYKGECDSEVMLSYLETLDIPEALKSVHGQAALAFAPNDPEAYELYLWRHYSPLEVAYSKSRNTLLIASTESILRSMITKYELEGLIKNTEGWLFSSVDEHVLWKVFINQKGTVEAEYKGYFRPDCRKSSEKETSVYSVGRNYGSGIYTTWKEREDYQLGMWHKQQQKALEEQKEALAYANDTYSSEEEAVTAIVKREEEEGEITGDCPPFGFSESNRTCAICQSYLPCKVSSEKDIEELTSLSAEQIIQLKGCNGYYSTGDIECKTCILRTMCAQEIVENWDETDLEQMLGGPYYYDYHATGTCLTP